MSAGYIQLTALGQQDVWLTGEPQVTYFSGVYRRHTPFVLEAFEIPFLGQTVKYGSKSICRIPPKGDLVRGLTLTVTLPQLAPVSGADAPWYWPIVPDSVNSAQFSVNSASNAPVVGPSNLTWYSTYNAYSGDAWLTSTAGGNGRLSNWVRYDIVSNKFIFGNYGGGTLSTLWVRPSNANDLVTNQGIFWGLDPLRADLTQVYNGTTFYGYTVTDNSLVAHLSIEQAGWIPSPTDNLPPAQGRSGLYLQTTNPVSIGNDPTFINFAEKYSPTSNYWTNWDARENFTVTPGGRISFASTGLYIMKIGFGLDSGSLSNVAWGLTVEDGDPGLFPVFSESYEPQVSPNPSSPVVFPINITSTDLSVYVFAGGTGNTVSPGSYVTVNQADDYFYLKNYVTNGTVVPIDSSNTVYTGSTTTIKLDDGTFKWKMKTDGVYIMTSVVSVSSGYATEVKLSEGANTVYTYDMSSQGRNPTFAFTIPIIVTDVARKYFISMKCSDPEAVIQAGSYFIFNQVGITENSSTGTRGILPLAGLTFQSNGPIFRAPFRIGTTDFLSNGTNTVETISGTSNLNFSADGTYILTGTLCTADQVTSISINTWSSTGNTVTTYPVGLGLQPPYTVNMPFRITNTGLDSNTTILATVNGTTTTPNIFSNTFISIYPFAHSLGGVVTQFPYYDSVGTLVIDTAELKIGGQSVQTISGEYIELWNDLNVPYENQPALKVLTGKYDTSNIITARTYYINLPFYFSGAPELSVPICALDRQDLEVHVTFNKFSALTPITSSTTPSLANPTLTATIIAEYVYLSDPEIDWFRRSRIEQVIIQNQYATINLPYGFASGVFPLNFNNPVRELFFVFQNDTSLPYNYQYTGLRNLGLSFNGYDAFTTTTTDVIYLGTIEPFNHYTNFPARTFNMYSFCTNPGSINPSGFVNFSRIKNILLTLNLDPSSVNTRVCRVTAVNYNVLRFEGGLAGLAFSSS